MPGMPVSAIVPPVTPIHLALHHTRFSNWFPLYRRHTPKATLIDLLSLQPDFQEWLEEDGIILPLNSEDVNNIEYSDESDEEEGEEGNSARNFDVLNNRIRAVISQYNGAVFPKLDWSAPLDAAWIVPGSSLRCTTPSDVYLLLKSSDFVSKDIKQLKELERMKRQQAFGDSLLTPEAEEKSQGIRPFLVLKKYFSIPKSHEFRSFVRAGKFLCISQRDTGTFYEHLQDSTMQLKIRRLLQSFFEEILHPQPINGDASSSFNAFPISDFVWDAYISRDMSKIFLVDVNPYSDRTDSLLWSWDELEKIAEKRFAGDPMTNEDEEESDSEEEEEEESVIRIFTDGRPPVLMHTNDLTESDGRKSTRDNIPLLRTITSRAQTTQTFPTYVRNMIPSDVVGAAEGNNIAQFAREWNDQIAQATRGDVVTSNDADDIFEKSRQALPRR